MPPGASRSAMSILMRPCVWIDEALRLAADRVSAEIEALLAGPAAVDRKRSGSQVRDIAPHVEPVTDTSRSPADPGSARIVPPD